MSPPAEFLFKELVERKREASRVKTVTPTCPFGCLPACLTVCLTVSLCVCLPEIPQQGFQSWAEDAAEVRATFGNEMLPSSGGERKKANGAWTEEKWAEREVKVAAHVCAARLANNMSEPEATTQTMLHAPNWCCRSAEASVSAGVTSSRSFKKKEAP